MDGSKGSWKETNPCCVLYYVVSCIVLLIYFLGRWTGIGNSELCYVGRCTEAYVGMVDTLHVVCMSSFTFIVISNVV